MWRTILVRNMSRPFASKKQHISVEQIRNNNLRFQADNWMIHLFPFYPQIYKKKTKDVYEISNSTVLAMTFVNLTVAEDVAWANRKSITLKFKELASLVNVSAGSGEKIAIQTSNTYRQTVKMKQFKVEDMKKEKMVKINLQSHTEKARDAFSQRNKQLDWELTANLPHTEYRVMHKLIQSSLFDLSGWRLMLELQKKQQLEKLEGNMNVDKELEELINQ